jgi:alkylation response protein AidB-like acyl-CoA dehydrogenase
LNFDLTEDQIRIRDMVRQFAREELAPHAAKWDEEQHFPREILGKLGEMGLLGILWDERWNGAGLSYVDYATILEELAVVDPAVALTVAAHNSLCSGHISIAGNDDQKEKWLKPLATGEMIGAWGLTEAEAGSDSSGTRTTAVLEGDEWVLNGSKNFITNASVGDVAVLMAVTDRNARKHGISAFVVPLKGQKGISVGKKENKLGMRASDTATLIMEDCRVPKENLLGSLGEGFIDSMKVLDGGRISIAALSVGLARGAFEAARDYAKQRKQFGRAIAEFQAIQFYLADMATEIDAARLLVLRAAMLKDSHTPTTTESAMAKLYASEIAVRAAERGLQIHGGYGFIKDFKAERYFRDVKLCTIGEGTSEIQRLVIARRLLGQ